MSTAPVDRWRDRLDATGVPRLLACGAVGGLIVTYVSVFRRITDVAGDPQALVAVAAVSVLAGALAAPVVSGRLAAALSTVALVVGGVVYLVTLDAGAFSTTVAVNLVNDSVKLLTGESLLGIVNADVWAMAGVPAPAFLTTYLAVRRHYVGAAAVGGATLSVFVLTGDASSVGTLFAALAATAAVGFGEVDARGGFRGADTVVAVLAAMVVVTVSVTVVPAGGALGAPAIGDGGPGPGGPTVEGNLITTDSELRIRGSLSLSPKVRFRVRADRPRYWRVGSYDRYTSGGWIRTGSSRPFRGASGSPGPSRRLVQEFDPAVSLGVLPAAWKPVSVSGTETGVRQTTEGGVEPAGTLRPSDSYTVVSSVPAAGPGVLRGTGRDYPDRIERRYTQLPASTPDRVRQRTARITANADNPYDTARVIERWLENNREYSLDVSRPSGDVADAFLFERSKGYCTYFATTMVVMLRSQGIPARFVVGYTPGERVASDEWVARGMDAHAWVEVYFPDAGWIRFDPTPGGPRAAAEARALESARSAGVSGVDTAGTGPAQWTPTADGTGEDTGDDSPTPSDLRERLLADNGSGSPGEDGVTPGSAAGGSDGDGSGVPLPSREEAVLGGIVLAGAVAGARRAGLTDRAYRAIWVRRQPRVDPRTDVERAYRRATWVIERRWRPRRPGETPGQYLRAAGDNRATRLAGLYERARYAEAVDASDAHEAVWLADELVSTAGGFRGR